MKNALLILLTALMLPAFAQYDKKAKDILDKTSANTKSFSSMKVEFLYVQENVDTKKKTANSGNLTLKGNKYKLDLMGNTIMCDSKTVWSYVKENNEVNISNVEDHQESLFNPAKLFTIYEKGFKYKFIRERFEKARALYEIELFPEKVDESEYSKIRLLIDKDKMQIFEVLYVSKDANRITVEIGKITPNQTINDSEFVFNKTNYPKVEVVDMR